ncbi:phage terminase large subunit [Blastococcus mobilis]|uniref:Terminase-like family protein n=1 Tax=Blastococcus mobilis TaxID=1938746 RepID=A0A238VXH3_9ACTN|nr:phage terminase large subunit [Blastococcus mobilis]SNR38543.1 Terminase-like family protein [Blastococcus mobilis]
MATVWDLVLEGVLAEYDPKPPTLPGYEPQPKQSIAEQLAGEVFEMLYGGAAGGGKSYWLRHSAVLYCLTHPGAYVAIVRRTLPMLRKTHHRPLQDICRGLATHNKSDLSWTFPNGAVLQLISLTHDGDEQDYKSVEFDRLYFDELTEFTEAQYTYMLTRLRSSNGHPTAAIGATNPEGVGYAWVKRRFVKPRPGDLAEGQGQPVACEPWRPPLPDGSGPGRARVFVPATLLDNPALLAANPEYEMTLRSMTDPRKRKALLEGDWDAMDQVQGAQFSLTNIDNHRVHKAPADLARVVVGYDPATTFTATSDETGIVAAASAQATRPRQMYVLADRSARFGSPEQAARTCVDVAWSVQADAIVYETNQGGDYVKAALNSALRHAVKEGRWKGPLPKVLGVHAKRGKALRAEPVSVYYDQGQVHHVGPFEELEGQMTTWTPGNDSPDRLDALVYAITHLEEKAAPAGPVPIRSLW